MTVVINIHQSKRRVAHSEKEMEGKEYKGRRWINSLLGSRNRIIDLSFFYFDTIYFAWNELQHIKARDYVYRNQAKGKASAARGTSVPFAPYPLALPRLNQALHINYSKGD